MLLIMARLRRIAFSIRGSQMALVESTTGTIAITRDEYGKQLGFVTLHDLLRAQVSVSERER